MTYVSLDERVACLGRMVVRGNIACQIEALEAAGPERRAELAESFPDHQLVDLVDDFGGAAVLAAISRAAARFRREGLDLARTP